MARFRKSLRIDVRKVDDERKQLFGIASLVTKFGEPVVDRQGDRIAPEELEKAVYE